MKTMKDVMSKLTDEHRARLKNEIVAHLERYDDFEEQKKERTRDLTAKMKSERADFTRKRNALKSGEIEEDIECEEVQDFERNAVRVVRCDTGETVATRAMKGEERQQHIDEIPEVQAAAGKKKGRLQSVPDSSEPKKVQ